MEDNGRNISHLRNIFEKSHSQEITRLYDLYRTPFILFIMKNFRLKEDVIIDVYQESFMALYNNVREEKLTQLTCSLKTYLFKIGTHKAYRHIEKTKNTEIFEELDHLYDIEDDHSPEWLDMQEKIWEIVNQLQEPCNTVLNLFYWKQKTMREIADRMKYSNEQVAKNRKSLCLKTLKERIKELILE